ncbi:hypothetical protein [Enterovibrio norvegicus]|uniref:Cyclic nucleotide-binding domain-containing protein n=1 Tax=Enterovibrio norvegicus TaxID=188144 RepID=A0ABV4LAQ9_9GAMM
MDVMIEKHGLVEGLFIIVSGHLKIYFQYVGYDGSEQCLIFERDDEVITGRIAVETDVQLNEWEKAFNQMNIGIEQITE